MINYYENEGLDQREPLIYRPGLRDWITFYFAC